MATIKSYTDLSQSKTLSKILPLESADMRYDEYTSHIDGTPKVGYKEGITEGIPCWSFAALLELLPKRLEIEDNVYELNICLYGPYYWNITNGNLCFELKDKDNLVDACYELILKLNELNLL